jgi:hypothetical protein
MRHVIFARSVATLAIRMLQSAAAACLVAATGRPQRSLTGLRRAVGAIDIAAVATAADQHLIPAIGAEKKPRWRYDAAAPSAAWTHLSVGEIMPLHSCSCTV